MSINKSNHRLLLYQTLIRFITAALTAKTGFSKSGIAAPSSASSCRMTRRDTYEINIEINDLVRVVSGKIKEKYLLSHRL